MTETGRHGNAVPRHRHAVRRIAHLGVPRQRAEEVYAMSLGHTVLSSGRPQGAAWVQGYRDSAIECLVHTRACCTALYTMMVLCRRRRR